MVPGIWATMPSKGMPPYPAGMSCTAPSGRVAPDASIPVEVSICDAASLDSIDDSASEGSVTDPSVGASRLESAWSVGASEPVGACASASSEIAGS